MAALWPTHFLVLENNSQNKVLAVILAVWSISLLPVLNYIGFMSPLEVECCHIEARTSILFF